MKYDISNHLTKLISSSPIRKHSRISLPLHLTAFQTFPALLKPERSLTFRFFFIGSSVFRTQSLSFYILPFIFLFDLLIFSHYRLLPVKENFLCRQVFKVSVRHSIYVCMHLHLLVSLRTQSTLLISVTLS